MVAKLIRDTCYSNIEKQKLLGTIISTMEVVNTNITPDLGISTKITDNSIILVSVKTTKETLTLPEGIEIIKFITSTNYICDSVKELYIPSTLKEIDSPFTRLVDVFPNIEKVIFAENCVLDVLPDKFFRDTPKLKTVVLPTNIRGIRDNCFCNSGLRDIIIPDSVVCIAEDAFNSSNIQNIVFSKNLGSLSKYCFRDCTNLKEVHLPSSLKQIDEYSFLGTELEKITVGGIEVENLDKYILFRRSFGLALD